jgi:ornithine cyclodeaminase
MLFDAATGVPVAVLLDEGRLTDIRTAVAGAIAAKWLAPKKVEAIGVIGTGIQARLQVSQLMAVTACRTLCVYGRKREAVDAYCREKKQDGFDAVACATPAEVAARANLIVTATPAIAPLLRAQDIRPGTHITAVGADTPEKNEIAADVFAKADRIVADSVSQCSTRGEIHHALAKGAIGPERIVELGTIIVGDAPGRQHDSEITIADLTGVAVQDIKIAQAVFAAIEAEAA